MEAAGTGDTGMLSRRALNAMATSHSSISLCPSPVKPLSFPARRENTGRIRLILGFRRLLLWLACPRHAWNWPRLLRIGGHEDFDAHQTCFKCNTERFYNTRLLKAGPLYRVRVPWLQEKSDRE